MIPQSSLESLKPLRDQINRESQVKSKRSSSFRKGRLSKRARQWAWMGSSGLRIMKDYKGPQGKRSYGNLPIKEREK